MDFNLIINGYDYSDIEDLDSEFEDNGPDLFEPLDSDSPLLSPIITPQRSPSPIIEPPPPPPPTHAILPADKPPPIPPPKKSYHIIRARIQALTL